MNGKNDDGAGSRTKGAQKPPRKHGGTRVKKQGDQKKAQLDQHRNERMVPSAVLEGSYTSEKDADGGCVDDYDSGALIDAKVGSFEEELHAAKGLESRVENIYPSSSKETSDVFFKVDGGTIEGTKENSGDIPSHESTRTLAQYLAEEEKNDDKEKAEDNSQNALSCIPEAEEEHSPPRDAKTGATGRHTPPMKSVQNTGGIQVPTGHSGTESFRNSPDESLGPHSFGLFAAVEKIGSVGMTAELNSKDLGLGGLLVKEPIGDLESMFRKQVVSDQHERNVMSETEVRKLGQSSPPRLPGELLDAAAVPGSLESAFGRLLTDSQGPSSTGSFGDDLHPGILALSQGTVYRTELEPNSGKLGSLAKAFSAEKARDKVHAAKVVGPLNIEEESSPNSSNLVEVSVGNTLHHEAKENKSNSKSCPQQSESGDPSDVSNVQASKGHESLTLRTQRRAKVTFAREQETMEFDGEEDNGIEVPIFSRGDVAEERGEEYLSGEDAAAGVGSYQGFLIDTRPKGDSFNIQLMERKQHISQGGSYVEYDDRQNEEGTGQGKTGKGDFWQSSPGRLTEPASGLSFRRGVPSQEWHHLPEDDAERGEGSFMERSGRQSHKQGGPYIDLVQENEVAPYGFQEGEGYQHRNETVGRRVDRHEDEGAEGSLYSVAQNNSSYPGDDEGEDQFYEHDELLAQSEVEEWTDGLPMQSEGNTAAIRNGMGRMKGHPMHHSMKSDYEDNGAISSQPRHGHQPPYHAHNEHQGKTGRGKMTLHQQSSHAAGYSAFIGGGLLDENEYEEEVLSGAEYQEVHTPPISNGLDEDFEVEAGRYSYEHVHSSSNPSPTAKEEAYRLAFSQSTHEKNFFPPAGVVGSVSQEVLASWHFHGKELASGQKGLASMHSQEQGIASKDFRRVGTREAKNTKRAGKLVQATGIHSGNLATPSEPAVEPFSMLGHATFLEPMQRRGLPPLGTDSYLCDQPMAYDLRSLELVLRHITTPQDWLSFSLVCKRWHSLAFNRLSTLNVQKPSDNHRMSYAGFLSALSHCASLMELKVMGGSMDRPMSDDLLCTIGYSCPKLRHLSVRADPELGFCWSESGFNVLFTGCTALLDLSLEGSKHNAHLSEAEMWALQQMGHQHAGPSSSACGESSTHHPVIRIPESLGFLSQLQSFTLSFPAIQAHVYLPEALGSLAHLTYLELNCGRPVQVPAAVWSMNGLEVLHLGGWQGLAFLPDCMKELKSLRELGLRCTDLLDLPPSLGLLPCLTQLSWEGKRNKELEAFSSSVPPSLSALTHLKSLSLRNLWTLSDDLAALEGSLTHLELWGAKGQLRVIPESLGELQRLKHLDLRGSFRVLPQSLGLLTAVTSLKVLSEVLEELPDSISQLSRLRRINLEGCRANPRLPTTFWSLTSLTSLRMPSYFLPEDIGNLNQLQEMSIESDADTTEACGSLPSRIGWLFELADLRLVCPFVRSLPEGLNYLGKLTKLQLKYSGPLPNSFGQLTSLKELILDSSEVYVLPDSFGNLKKLECLTLACPKLGALPESFGRLEALRSLSLLGCISLATLPTSFCNLSSLEELELVCKDLRWLPNAFGHLSLLRNLYLKSSALKELPDSFNQLLSLRRLRLSCPALTNLPVELRRLPEVIMAKTGAKLKIV